MEELIWERAVKWRSRQRGGGKHPGFQDHTAQVELGELGQALHLRWPNLSAGGRLSPQEVGHYEDEARSCVRGYCLWGWAPRAPRDPVNNSLVPEGSKRKCCWLEILPRDRACGNRRGDWRWNVLGSSWKNTGNPRLALMFSGG